MSMWYIKQLVSRNIDEYTSLISIEITANNYVVVKKSWYKYAVYQLASDQ